MTLPGVAVWHVPWHEKDDTIDWQAYFHRRNRIVAALLHSPYDRGGRLVRESFETQVRHVLSMQYAPAEMGLMAIEDILEGPSACTATCLPPRARSTTCASSTPTRARSPTSTQFPAPRRKKPPRKGRAASTPRGRPARPRRPPSGGCARLRPVRELASRAPGGNHPARRPAVVAPGPVRLRNRLVGGRHDGRVVQTRPAAVQGPDGALGALHARLAREWPSLSETYREALPELASPKTWKQTFEGLDDEIDGGAAARG